MQSSSQFIFRVRGQRLHVLVYSRFSPNTFTTHRLFENHYLIRIGWLARFYAHHNVPEPVIAQLRSLGAEVFIMNVRNNGILPVEGDISGMFWRFMIADDPTVDRYVVRDTDSRLSARERFAVEEWIRSNRSTHSIRDHIWHYHPMMGGMWGSTKGAIQVKILRRLLAKSYIDDHD